MLPPRPKHEPAFRFRRAQNWLTLGFTYAAMYMARYNFGFANKALSDAYGWNKAQVGAIITAGTLVYGFSALFRGDDAGNIHGLNEHISVRSVMEGREFLYRLIKAYAEQKQP